MLEKIDKMLEKIDTDVVQPELDQDIDLMPHNQDVTLPSSPDMEAEIVQSDQGDTDILEDNLEADVHNICFNESQHKFVQLHRVPSLDVHVSPTQFEERAIVSMCTNIQLHWLMLPKHMLKPQAQVLDS